MWSGSGATNEVQTHSPPMQRSRETPSDLCTSNSGSTRKSPSTKDTLKTDRRAARASQIKEDAWRSCDMMRKLEDWLQMQPKHVLSNQVFTPNFLAGCASQNLNITKDRSLTLLRVAVLFQFMSSCHSSALHVASKSQYQAHGSDDIRRGTP